MHIFLASAFTIDFKTIVITTMKFYILYFVLLLRIRTKIDVICTIVRLKTAKTKAGYLALKLISHALVQL